MRGIGKGRREVHSRETPADQPTVGARILVKRIYASALEFSVPEILRSPVPKGRPYVSPG